MTPNAITSVVNDVPAGVLAVALELDPEPTRTLVTPGTITSVVRTAFEPIDDVLVVIVKKVPGDADVGPVVLDTLLLTSAVEADNTGTEVRPMFTVSVVNCPLAGAGVIAFPKASVAVEAVKGGVTIDGPVVRLEFEAGGTPMVAAEQGGSTVTVILQGVSRGREQPGVGWAVPSLTVGAADAAAAICVVTVTVTVGI